MTHIQNMPHILQYGITHSTSPNANPAYTPIGDASLINSRNSFRLDNGRLLGDYIPFYFGTRTPMLYVVQKGYNMVTPMPPENIIYCVSSVEKIIEHHLDFVFTDGHAVDKFSVQYSAKDIQKIDHILDKKAIIARYWNDENDLDIKRRKETEFLALGDVPFSALLGFIVYDENSKSRLHELGLDAAKILIKPEHYFKK